MNEITQLILLNFLGAFSVLFTCRHNASKYNDGSIKALHDYNSWCIAFMVGGIFATSAMFYHKIPQWQLLNYVLFPTIWYLELEQIWLWLFGINAHQKEVKKYCAEINRLSEKLANAESLSYSHRIKKERLQKQLASIEAKYPMLESKICPNCETANKKEAEFCTACQHQFTK